MIRKHKSLKYLILTHSNNMEVINALGRRKTSVARVYLSKGTGKMTVNKKDYKVAFPISVLQAKIERPFQLTDTVGQYDISVNVFGGGINGQAEAIRLGVARALVKVAEENKTLLKAEGLMTRDPRMVERKKPGQPKARKKFQFSKR
jgi:small subunit ribosomal protein S9